MTDDATASGNRELQQHSKSWEPLIWGGVGAGLILALIGVFDGFSVGGELSGLGTAIVVISLMLGIVIVFSGISAVASLRGKIHD